ncbi:ComEC/Rec2 family competence protein [Oerskovia jenensis]|uniref:Competence protein ComEC n=1 Tax=Oerskovia jenensis TaxID=162169 RepID=A0ABS2LK81_9CELL|nr:ComEC/Rec2 family competence protein [Oerskovia jenensis]MBM7480846.1 competence protein ComEC [Oerskovia jenensis]
MPSALASWGSAWWLSAAGPGPVLVSVVVTAVLLTLLGALLLTTRGRTDHATVLVGVVPDSGGPGALGSRRPDAVARTPRAPGAPGQRQRAPRHRRLGQVVVLLACVLAVLVAGSVHLVERAAGGAADLAARGATVEVVGRVVGEPEKVTNPWSGETDSVRTTLALSTVQGRGVAAPAGGQADVLAGLAWGDVTYGSEVRASGTLTLADPGDKAVATLVATGPPGLVAEPGPVLRTVDILRTDLLTASDGLPDDARALLPGVAVGDTSRIDDELDSALRTTGLTHVTAVSGGHFAIVVATVTALCATARAPRWARVVVTGAAMAGFVLLVHPDPSVLRAAAMGVVGLAGVGLGRPSRAMPALAAVVVVLLVLDPWLARSYGFVLSSVATAALVLGTQPVARRLAPWIGKVPAFALAVPLTAQLACAPILVLLDPSVATYAVPANLVAAPALVPATVLGVLATIVAPWFPLGGVLLAWPAGLASWWIAAVARFFADLPGARLPWPGGLGGAAALAVLTVVGIVLVWRWRWVAGLVGVRVPWSRGSGWPHAWRTAVRANAREAFTARRRRATLRLLVAWSLLATVATGCVVLAWPRWVAPAGRDVPADWAVTACDVGQGDGLVVRTGAGRGLMIDVGPAGDAAGNCLDELGVERLDLLVLTHFHADHVGGLDAVLDGRRVDRVLVTGLGDPAAQADRVLDDLTGRGVLVEVAEPGTGGVLGDVSWEVLQAGPGTTSSDPSPSRQRGRPTLAEADGGANDASIALLVTTPQLTLVTLGDLEDAGQEALERTLRSRDGGAEVDVVKVAHHGSRVQSPGLAALLSPTVAIVSSGENTYGHPTDAALDLYGSVGAAVLRTDRCGTFALVVRDAALAVAGCADG